MAIVIAPPPEGYTHDYGKFYTNTVTGNLWAAKLLMVGKPDDGQPPAQFDTTVSVSPVDREDGEILLEDGLPIIFESSTTLTSADLSAPDFKAVGIIFALIEDTIERGEAQMSSAGR